MPTAEAVARYFLHLAAGQPESSPLTQMQLHKLLYYAQGWSLGVRKAPLFSGRFEAWAHGPVVSRMYRIFAGHKGKPIPHREAAVDPRLSVDDRALIESVYVGYGKYAPWRLREMTHNEPPWRDARANLPDDAPSKAPIPDDSIARHFRAVHEARCRKAGIEPEALAESIRQARTGDTITLDELKARLASPGPGQRPPTPTLRPNPSGRE